MNSSTNAPPCARMRSRFCLGGIGRNVDPTLDLHRSARESNTLRMVTGTGSHYAGTAFGLVELSDQVVRATNLVRTNALEVLTLEIHVCPGQRRKTIAVLQGGVAAMTC